jgi:hypothetical protein
MYMCRLRHINDPVLSSLKMEGIRLHFCSNYASYKILTGIIKIMLDPFFIAYWENIRLVLDWDDLGQLILFALRQIIKCVGDLWNIM